MEKTQEYLELFKNLLTEYGPRIILAIFILWIGFKLVKRVEKILDNSLKSMSVTDTIRPFLNSLLSTILKIALLLFAGSVIGVEMSGLITIVAAMGFAVGMSLQGSLGNFASGILILFLKPYKYGDWISVDGNFGKVEEIAIFNTKIITPGNKVLIVPNSKITDDVVTNYSEKGLVRLELNTHIPYSEDFPKVKALITKELQGIDLVLNDPKPEIGIENFDTHYVELAIRPYVKPNDYWEATFKVHEGVKRIFSENNVKVAYSEGVELGEIGA